MRDAIANQLGGQVSTPLWIPTPRVWILAWLGLLMAELPSNCTLHMPLACKVLVWKSELPGRRNEVKKEAAKRHLSGLRYTTRGGPV